MADPTLKDKLAGDMTPVSKALFGAVIAGLGPALKKALDTRFGKADAHNARS